MGVVSKIGNHAVEQVRSLHHEVTTTKYHKRKKELFREMTVALDAEGLWLITFCCWFCLYNFRFRQIDESRYWSIPEADETTATFQEFLQVIRFFDRKNVTPSREGVLIRFLSRCSKDHKEFYLSLLAKSFIKNMPLTEIQLTLDLDSISAQELYGSVEMLKTSFAELTYPVAVTGVSSPGASLCVVVREPHNSYSFTQREGRYHRTEPLLTTDSRYIRTPRYTLAGFAAEQAGRTIFHPIDCFDTLKEFHGYLKGKQAPVYPGRVEKVRRFQEQNFLTQVTTTHIGVAHCEEEIIPEVVKALAEVPYGYVVLTDSNTARTGTAHAVEGLTAYGIIDDFWVEAGTPKGFICWFNGQRFPVEFSFAGKYTSLLNDIEPAKGKLLDFLYVKFGTFRTGIGRSILWDRPTWREKRLRWTDVYIEKCALCGQTKHAHASRGICHICERNLYRSFEKHGPDTWIVPAPITTKLRRENAWEHTLLNRVRYIHQGHLLEAREDGCWRFVAEKGEEDSNTVTADGSHPEENQG